MPDFFQGMALLESAVGQRIEALCVETDELRFTMADDSRFALYDAGQACCESRYLTCDDDLAPFVGALLRGVEVREGPTEEADGGVHETAFLIVRTSLGEFTVATHNEHNGYYGGFALACKAIE